MIVQQPITVAGLLVVVLFAKSVAAKQPNILLILADDYGWNDVGFHGSEIRTPTLDKLAGEGVKLQNYFVQPICTPTRSQLLSGRYQIHTGLQHGIIWAGVPNGLPLSDPTIADKLREAGYSTHAVGKWHLGFYKKEYTPTRRGFDSFYGYLTGSEDYFTHGRNSGGPMCPPFQPGLDLHHNEELVRNESGHYSAELFAQQAQRLVESHNPDKPLFMYLPFQSVHSPLQVPEKYVKQYSHVKDKNRRIYSGMVTCMDEAVKNVTEAFKRKGLWNNTILIFSTDNGGQILSGGNNWPLRGWKGSLWDGGMRAVGFVNSPLLKNKGVTSHELMHVTDWYPTMLHLAGASTSGLKLDGYNQWQTINKGMKSPRKELLHNIDPLTGSKGKNVYPHLFDIRTRAALRSGDWKIITGNPGNGSWIPVPGSAQSVKLPLEPSAKNLWLFDVKKDPEERHDLSNTNPDVVKFMLKRLSAYKETAVKPVYPPCDPQANPGLHGNAWVPWRNDS